ncbi:nuclease-related domain-containing protein, partial [Persephonella sp.]
ITVQIDHLLIFRTDIVILESKYFSSTLIYDNKNDSFNIKTQKGIKGIPDPRKQVERQIINFRNLLERTKLKVFFPPEISFYILVSPNVYLKTQMPDKIVKADKFIDKFREEDENISLIKGLQRVKNYMSYSFDKILYGAEQLKALHTPLSIDDYLQKLKLGWVK